MKQTPVRQQAYEPTSDADQVRRLSNHTDRSGSTVHGWPSVAVGALFTVVGLALAVLTWLGTLAPSPGVPEWIGPVVGLVFAVAGVSFVVHGSIGVEVQARVRRLRETHVRQPWVWDHPWDELGSRDDSSRRIGRAVWFASYLALFLLPFNWVGFFSEERPIIFAVVAALMDALLIACVGRAAYLIAQRAKYGPTMMRFRRFPFRIGQEIELHMARPAQLSGISSAEAVLRCVEERYEVRGSGKDRRKEIVAYELWSDRQRGDVRRGEFIWRFTVPEGIPGTALSERPPRYFEVELVVEMPGIDFARTYLVPVYASGE